MPFGVVIRLAAHRLRHRRDTGSPQTAHKTLSLFSGSASSNLDDHALSDYYAVLAVPPSASPAQIKQAYHRTLLLSHPDKHPQSVDASQSTHPTIDIGLLKTAYTTLSSPALRSAYDAARLQKPPSGVPRPAQVVSLEDFDEAQEAETAQWVYACRCGGRYLITETEMEAGQHLVGCSSCSEVVWVGYEPAEEGT
ncbi:DnaJ domain-containing protein [Amylocystis lapponica]|nr:DnaJ domain-containing protein [Amylocystis lapponica]